MVDTVVVNAPTGEDDPQHVQQMVDVVDNANKAANEAASGNEPTATEGATEERPTWLPEKFKSAEDLAKAYSELEAKLGGKKDDPAPTDDGTQTTENTDKPDGEVTNTEQAREELANRGLDLDTFSQEFAQTGKLSDASYETLEKSGLSRSVVNSFIAGQQALAERFQSEVKSIAGGDEGFSGMVEWARVNADPKEVAAYNKAIDSGDVDAAKLAVAGMYQKYLEARPSEGQLINGKSARGVGGEVYESVEDYVKDASNPEYKSNPAFRNRVIAKLGRSNIL